MKVQVLVISIVTLLATIFNVQSQDYKNLEPPEDKSLVYVYRPSVAGGVIPMPVLYDNNLIGITKAKDFVYAFLEPGEHYITSEAESSATIQIKTEAGKTYYVRQKVKMGIWVASTDLELVDEEKGRHKLNKSCKPPKNWSPRE